MPVPILLHAGVLVVSMHTGQTDRDLSDLRDALAGKIGAARAHGVVLDVSALDVLDSFACRTLRTIAQTSWLRGARTVVVGIQPDVAFSMVQLGLSMDGVETVLDLEEAMALIAAGFGERHGDG